MGLDIFFYKTSEPATDNNNLRDFWEVERLRRVEAGAKLFDKQMKLLEGKTGEELAEVALQVINTLAKNLNYPQYSEGLTKHGYGTGKVLDIETLPSIREEYIIECNDLTELTYFRKVNFLYRYFASLSDFDDDVQMCPVTLYDVDEIIERCEKVLKRRTTYTSKKYLPTVSGFFFGSTEYDEYYYQNVEEVLSHFKNEIRPFLTNETEKGCLVYFSW